MTNYTSTVWPLSSNNDFCRCICIQLRSSATPKVWYLEASCICLSIHVKDGLSILCPNRKGSTGHARNLLRKHTEIETDHKRFVPTLEAKHLDCLLPRILRFHLCLDRFSYDINHVPGKQLYTADTLSRVPLPTISIENTQEELSELCIAATISHLPASNQQLETYRQAQSSHPICQQYCREGWPNKQQIESALKAYWPAQEELTESNRLLMLMYGQRTVIPTALQAETLSKLHEGHQGAIYKQRSQYAWWPGISKQLASFTEGCPECARDVKQAREPLIPTYLSTLISLVKGGCRYLHLERTEVLGHNWLLFKISESIKA